MLPVLRFGRNHEAEAVIRSLVGVHLSAWGKAFFLPLPSRVVRHSRTGGYMRYIVGWMLGIPFSVIVLWYVVAHAGCGR